MNESAFPNGRFNGMDLRDYFAAKVLPTVYKDYMDENKNKLDEDWMFGVSWDCYKIADAMMMARSAREVK
jgi:hypothetical protein